MSKRIGVIGLGLLGSAVAERLLRAGYHVAGFDLAEQPRQQFQDTGGRACESSRAVFERCTTVILCLPDSDVVWSTLRSVEAVLKPEHVIIDCSTGSPTQTDDVAEWSRRREVVYLDAPVAGSSQLVRNGQSVVLIGGDAADVDGCQELLESTFGKCVPTGASGTGIRMKLVFNLVLGLHRLVLAEGLGMAEAMGLDLQQTLNVLQSGAAASRAMEHKGGRMIREEFTPQARLRQHAKDVNLMCEFATTEGVRVPLSRLHLDLLQEAIDEGWGDLDNSAVIRLFRKARENGAGERNE